MADFFATLSAQVILRSLVFLVYLVGCILSITGFTLMRMNVNHVRAHDQSIYIVYLIVVVLAVLHLIAFMIWMYTKRHWVWKFTLVMSIVTMYFVGAVSYHAAVEYKQRFCADVRGLGFHAVPGVASFCKGELLMMIGTLLLGLGYIVFPFTILPLGTEQSYIQISGGVSQA
jgi:multisubunit Na+/H+ antiporter MnhG subunit